MVAQAHRSVNRGVPSRTPDSPVLDELQRNGLRKGQPVSQALKRVYANARFSLKTTPPPITPVLSAHEKLQKKQAALDKDLDARMLRRRKFRSELLPEQKKEVQKFLSDRSLLVKIPGGEVSAKDMSLLKPGKWLNDEVINFYGIMINARSKEAEELRKQDEKENEGAKNLGKKKKVKMGEEIMKVHTFTSFFYNKLHSAGYDGVRRWTKKVCWDALCQFSTYSKRWYTGRSLRL